MIAPIRIAEYIPTKTRQTNSKYVYTKVTLILFLMRVLGGI